MIGFISLPELKAQVTFLITYRPSVCTLFTFSSSSTESLVLDTKHSWLKMLQVVFFMKSLALFQGEIIAR